MRKTDERLGVDGFTYTVDPRWQAPKTRWGLLAVAIAGLGFLFAAAVAAVLP